MNVYKVTFANNCVSNCHRADQRFDHDSEYYYEYNGRMVYAMVKADSIENAIIAGEKLLKSAGNASSRLGAGWAAAA